MNLEILETLTKINVLDVQCVQKNNNLENSNHFHLQQSEHSINKHTFSPVQSLSIIQSNDHIGHKITEVEKNMSSTAFPSKRNIDAAFKRMGHNGHIGHENKKSLLSAHEQEQFIQIINLLINRFGGSKQEWEQYINDRLLSYSFPKLLTFFHQIINERS